MSQYYMTAELREKRMRFLTRRQDGVGGSDMPAILGLVKGRNALDIYHQKTRPIREEDIEDDSIHQWRGHRFEAMAIEEYRKKTGRNGRLMKEAVSHPSYPNVLVSRDFTIFADPDRDDWTQGTGTGEMKNPSSFVFGKVIDEGLRYSELVQLQTEIAASQHTWGSIAYFNAEHDQGPIHYADQPYDPFLGPWLLEHGQRFWDEHVAPRIPPDPKEWAKLLDNPDAPEIADLSGEVVTVRDDRYLGMLTAELEAKDVKKEAEEAYKQIKDRLHEATVALGHKKVQVPGIGKATVVTQSGRKRIDTNRLEEHRPIDRDKLMHWLESRGIDVDVTDLELDFEPFRTQSDPYQYTLSSRSRDV